MMARLEHIHYEFFDASLHGQGEFVWAKQAKTPIVRLPQIFWEDGRGWHEANVWALERAASHEVDAETIKRLMKHLSRYADYLEVHGIDWQHFPVRKDDQVLRKFRKNLIDQVKNGLLAGSTAANSMNAVIQFYRFADLHNLVRAEGPMWVDRLAVIPFHDAAGFKRSMVRLTSDLKIPNRKRAGASLEDGLLPLRSEHMSELLTYTTKHEIEELHLMLSTGFFTGARIGTITTLTVTSLQTAREDPRTPGVYLLPVGPGTGVATKFSVSGDLMVPKAVLDDLKGYASSTARLLREAKAQPADKNLLFLARSGRRYTVDTVNRLVYEMRKRATGVGLRFMQRFRFHQSRATFGTWLVQILLDNGVKTTDAIAVVRDAMLHKNEVTTLGYITFLEKSRGKEQAAAAFNQAFTGLRCRNWDKANA
ncbi:site-specific integrase [Paraburkholderia sediminicola]|uniref:site-specific integrase n=1 Tax=Paraburkholderia sediminicola TaxID=458836 RepID=UPI0038BD30A5